MYTTGNVFLFQLLNQSFNTVTECIKQVMGVFLFQLLTQHFNTVSECMQQVFFVSLIVKSKL